MARGGVKARDVILHALCRCGPMTFMEIVHSTGYSKAAVSQALKVLIAWGLVVYEAGRYRARECRALVRCPRARRDIFTA